MDRLPPLPAAALCAVALPLAALLLWSAGTAAAAPGGDAGGVHRFERVREWRLDRPSGPALREGDRARGARLRFTAGERPFVLELDSNHELLVDLPEAVRSELDGIELFKGRVAGRDGSWVRLTRVGDQWAGLLFDGSELLALEPELGLEGPDASDPVLYRLEDVEATGTCAVADTAAAAVTALSSDLEAFVTAAAQAALFIDVAVIADRRFTRDQSDAMGRAVALFNAVDGIYSEQVGVAINVVDVDLRTDNGPLTSSDAGELLDQLADWAATRELDNPGLIHLLTGRNLDGSTVGIAFIGTLCSESAGVSLSEIRNGSFAIDTVLIAHELGHNFGAPHDNELGSLCAATPSGYIMSPNLGDTSDRFSSCSLDRMEPEIDSARCLGELPDEPVVEAPCVFENDFESGTGGFTFKPDRQTPRLSAGEAAGGILRSDVGGVNTKNKRKMKGTWQLVCSVETPTSVEISLDANLVHAARYDTGENSRLRLRVDKERYVLARIKGADDDGDVDLETGFQTYLVDAELSAGNHRIRLDCLNNRKTGKREVTRCEFDGISVTER
jgi:hypothetical protein